MSARIRPVRQGDFDTLWQIDQACFDPQLAYSRIDLAVYMRRPSAFTLVAEDLGPPSSHNAHTAARIVGFIVAETCRATGHIITIDVVAEARRSGIGSALLDAAEQQIRQTGVRQVALETPVNNLAAIRFYKQKGYFVEETMPGYYSNHLDAFVMSKKLAAAAVESPVS